MSDRPSALSATTMCEAFQAAWGAVEPDDDALYAPAG
jgi:hypothetical protein